MKTTFWIIFLLAFTLSVSAQKYISKTGHIWFYSHTAIEDIEAHNNQVASILDAATGDIQFSLLIRSFEFKIALMQEHFNVNYMESETYPKASFKGKITNLDKINFKTDGSYDALAEGDLTIHGVTKHVSIPGKVIVKNGLPTVQSKFKVLTEDYKIVIPDLVKEKIAKEIEVTVDISYQAN